MEETPKENQVRKTVSFTHRQLGVGTGIAGLLIAIAPVKEWFFTREEGTSLTAQVSQLRQEQAANFAEMKRIQERSADKIIERIKDSGEVMGRNVDRLERRVESLEAARNRSSEKRISL